MLNNISVSIDGQEGVVVFAPLDPCHTIKERQHNNVHTLVILAKVTELSQGLPVLGPVGTNLGW